MLQYVWCLSRNQTHHRPSRGPFWEYSALHGVQQGLGGQALGRLGCAEGTAVPSPPVDLSRLRVHTPFSHESLLLAEKSFFWFQEVYHQQPPHPPMLLT